MKKRTRVLFYEMFLIALLFTSPDMVRAQTVAEQSSTLHVEKTNGKDLRMEKLKVYLTKHNSPAAEFAGVFVKKADEYGLDWHLVAAIFGVESTFGKHVPANSHNGWGWGIPTGTSSGIGFKSWDNGIEVVSKGLKEKYVDRGLDTPEKMGPVYAPPSTTWARNVRFFMSEIENVTLKPELSI